MQNGIRGRSGRVIATVLMRSGLLYGSEILRQPTRKEMALLEQPWQAAARLIGASRHSMC
jgi:hypothetical protein